MRIVSLEQEVAWYKAQIETDTVPVNNESSKEELLRKIDVLEKRNEILSSELPALEAAFNKAHKQSQKKILELVEYEEKLARLQAEVIILFFTFLNCRKPKLNRNSFQR